MSAYKIGQGQLYLQPQGDEAVRHGGLAFQYDKTKALWVCETESAGWGTYRISFNSPLNHGLFGWAYNDSAAARPATASCLWDAPETVTGEIIAYRGWEYDCRIEGDGTVTVRLRSLHNSFLWDGPVATAHEVPAADNPSGLHAVALGPHHEGNFVQYVGDAPVWGRVALSGVVVEGTTGYRAERATIQELWINDDEMDEDDAAEGLCKLLGDRYQCDVSVQAPEWSDLVKADQ